jgi:hypothetical protein
VTCQSYATERVCRELSSYAFAFGDERELHDAIADVLTKGGISFQREYVSNPANRFDFLCDGGVVLEIKTKGSLPEALRQCARYCERPEVFVVVLAASRSWAKRTALRPGTFFNGKPVLLLPLRSQAL